MFSSLERTEPVCVETVLLVLPELFTGSETLCALGLVPPLPLFALCLLEGTFVGVVEGEGARGGEAHVEILVADLVYARIRVVGDVYAFEFQEEDFRETDVVECVRDLYLVLEGLWRRRVRVSGWGRKGKGDARLEGRREGGVGDWGEGASAFLGSLPCEGDGGDVTGSAAALHVRGRSTAESCCEHLEEGGEEERMGTLIVKT